MNLEKIKVKVLPEQVKEWCESNAVSVTTRFCAFLEYIKGEIVERCFATRIKKKTVNITEVSRICTGEKNGFIVKNLTKSYAGYNAVYKAEDIIFRSYGYPIKAFAKEDYDKWYHPDTCIGFSYVTINKDLIKSIPEFKYSGYSGGNVISYINAYRKDKNVEMFGKLGISLSPILINKAKKDGKFRRFLFENHKAININGVQATLFAYKHNMTLDEARRACFVKNQLDRLAAKRIPSVTGTKIDRQRLLDYVDSNDIDYRLYDDYLAAIKALKYNLNDTKNIYPKDFKIVHDLRAAEYEDYKIKQDAEKRKVLYKKFRTVAQKFVQFEQFGDKYCLIVPKDVSELIKEGEELHHCVGKMRYDQKMVDGKSLIMFCRNASDVSTPFATLEYDLKENKIRQFYALRNSKPTEDARLFVEEWAEKFKILREKEYDKSNNALQRRRAS